MVRTAMTQQQASARASSPPSSAPESVTSASEHEATPEPTPARSRSRSAQPPAVAQPQKVGGAKKTMKKGASSSRTRGRDGKRRKKSSHDSFARYIFKVLKTVHAEGVGISSKAMSIMDSMMKDVFHRLASEASTLVTKDKKSTIGAREIQTATRLVIPGELATHAILEANKNMALYYRHTEK